MSKNLPASVRQRLTNKAKETNRPFLSRPTALTPEFGAEEKSEESVVKRAKTVGTMGSMGNHKTLKIQELRRW